MKDLEIFNKKIPEFWEFLGANLPKYDSRDDVLLSDILFRYISGEDVCEKDLVWIKDEYNNDESTIKKELIRLECKFAAEAIEHFYEEF